MYKDLINLYNHEHDSLRAHNHFVNSPKQRRVLMLLLVTNVSAML